MNVDKFDNVENIGHAIAYVNVFMRGSHDIDESTTLNQILANVDSLSSQEVVSIIRDTVKRSNIYGVDVVLKEMESKEFVKFVSRKLNKKRKNNSNEYYGFSIA